MEDQRHIVIDYDELWESMLERTPHRDGEIIYPGAFVNWDNTPRKGPAGQSTLGANPQKFGQYLSRQIERAKKMFKSEYIYINAWNEWAEGAYLEPDERYQYQYLQAVKEALQFHHKKILLSRSARRIFSFYVIFPMTALWRFLHSPISSQLIKQPLDIWMPRLQTLHAYPR